MRALARFHTEPPPRFWPRNLRPFISDARSLVQNARLTAMVWVAQSDVSVACFESKYEYEFWRPQSAIPLAETDGIDATADDDGWTPVVPTPNQGGEARVRPGLVFPRNAQASERRRSIANSAHIANTRTVLTAYARKRCITRL